MPKIFFNIEVLSKRAQLIEHGFVAKCAPDINNWEKCNLIIRAHGDGDIHQIPHERKEKYKELEFLSARHELRPRIVHEKRSMHSKNRAGHWERICHGCVSQQTLSENFLVSAINYDISQTFLVLAAAISKHFLVTTMFCKTVLVLAVSLLSVLFFAVSLLFSVLSTHLNRSLPPPPSSARCTPCCLR